MNELDSNNIKGGGVFPLLILLAGVLASGFLFLQLEKAKTELAETRAASAKTQTDFEKENRELSEALYSEQQRSAELEEELDEVEDDLDEFEKLSKIDSELLQKYSKVYFLNEHYTPSGVVEIESEYRLPADKELSIHKRVNPFLENLLEAAQKSKIDIKVASAYRSFGEQSTLKSNYSVTYGTGGANQFSADQGYSEHQLGTTVDFTTVATGGALDGFNNTPAYTWLVANAYKYGFVLSYPEGNAYYVFEPWHWRFVGKDLAEDLRKKKIGFYDMDQRDIDKYLIKFFDR